MQGYRVTDFFTLDAVWKHNIMGLGDFLTFFLLGKFYVLALYS